MTVGGMMPYLLLAPSLVVEHMMGNYVCCGIFIFIQAKQSADFSGYVTTPPPVYPIIAAWNLLYQTPYSHSNVHDRA